MHSTVQQDHSHIRLAHALILSCRRMRCYDLLHSVTSFMPFNLLRQHPTSTGGMAVVFDAVSYVDNWQGSHSTATGALSNPQVHYAVEAERLHHHHQHRHHKVISCQDQVQLDAYRLRLLSLEADPTSATNEPNYGGHLVLLS